jgi:hypothetical protein
MSTKYEKLIDLIINEETDKARALFHQIVVEQSRSIYESLANEEDEVVEAEGDEEGVSDEATADFVDDASTEGDDEFDELDSEDDDAGVDVGDDVDSEGGEEDLEDRVLDLESAIDELKAEFDQLMAEEGDEPEHQDDAEVDSDDDEIEESLIREYVEKVATPANSEGQTVGTGRSTSVNKSSVVAGKNDMGGTSKNIARGGKEQDPDGTAATKKPSNEYTKGEGKLIGKVENSPGANTKGYADKRTAK